MSHFSENPCGCLSATQKQQTTENTLHTIRSLQKARVRNFRDKIHCRYLVDKSILQRGLCPQNRNLALHRDSNLNVQAAA